MRKIIFFILTASIIAGCSDNKSADQVSTESTASSTAPAANKIEGLDFGEAKYTALTKELLAAFEKGDIETWSNYFTEDVKSYFSGGDSVVGKKALSEYWTNRRKTVIDQLKFSNGLWLPLEVTKPQSVEAPGSWVLAWYNVDASYKNGKKINFWVHTAYHFNDNDKVDISWTYIDNAPIRAATAAK